MNQNETVAMYSDTDTSPWCKMGTFIRIHPVVFNIIEIQTSYILQHNTLILYSNVQQFSDQNLYT